MVPGKVVLDEMVVQVSAGDSHTAALTEDGTVFIWGAFRVSRSSRRLRLCEREHLFFSEDHMFSDQEPWQLTVNMFLIFYSTKICGWCCVKTL